jgi:hypothetical protein
MKFHSKSTYNFTNFTNNFVLKAKKKKKKDSNWDRGHPCPQQALVSACKILNYTFMRVGSACNPLSARKSGMRGVP